MFACFPTAIREPSFLSALPSGFPRVKEFSAYPPYPPNTWDAYYIGTNVTLKCEAEGADDLEVIIQPSLFPLKFCLALRGAKIGRSEF